MRLGHAQETCYVLQRGPRVRVLRPQEAHEVAEVVQVLEAGRCERERRPLSPAHPARHFIRREAFPRLGAREHLRTKREGDGRRGVGDRDKRDTRERHRLESATRSNEGLGGRGDPDIAFARRRRTSRKLAHSSPCLLATLGDR